MRNFFWKTVKSCWGNMSQQVLHQLVESMPGGVHAAIKEKGGKIFLNLCDFSKDSAGRLIIGLAGFLMQFSSFIVVVFSGFFSSDCR